MNTAVVNPSAQVLALADVEFLEVAAAFKDCLNTSARDTDAATDGKIFKFKEVQADAAERAVGHGRAAEREIQVGKHGTTKSKNLSCRVGESTAE